MATLKGSPIASTYDSLVKRADTWVQTGTNIELMDDSAVIKPTGLYLESGATTDFVGIGEAAPDSLLHLKIAATTGGSPVEILKLEIEDQGVELGGGIGPRIGFYIPHQSVSFLGATIEATKESSDDDNEATQLIFETCPNNGAVASQMIIKSDGGIFFNNLLGASGKTEVEWDSSTKELSYDSSDAALKTNIQVIPYGLAEINQLKPCMYDMYNWRINADEDGNNIGYTKSESPVAIGGLGLIAQEVAEVMPKLLIGDVLKSYKRKELITVMVKAIQELSAKVEALENNNNQGDSNNEQEQE